MTLLINGDSHPLPGVTNVAAVVEALQLPAPVLLIEHNGIALRRDQWHQTPVQDGDRLEIIRIVAGG